MRGCLRAQFYVFSRRSDLAWVNTCSESWPWVAWLCHEVLGWLNTAEIWQIIIYVTCMGLMCRHKIHTADNVAQLTINDICDAHWGTVLVRILWNSDRPGSNKADSAKKSSCVFDHLFCSPCFDCLAKLYIVVQNGLKKLLRKEQQCCSSLFSPFRVYVKGRCIDLSEKSRRVLQTWHVQNLLCIQKMLAS